MAWIDAVEAQMRRELLGQEPPSRTIELWRLTDEQLMKAACRVTKKRRNYAQRERMRAALIWLAELSAQAKAGHD